MSQCGSLAGWPSFAGGGGGGVAVELAVGLSRLVAGAGTGAARLHPFVVVVVAVGWLLVVGQAAASARFYSILACSILFCSVLFALLSVRSNAGSPIPTFALALVRQSSPEFDGARPSSLARPISLGALSPP